MAIYFAQINAYTEKGKQMSIVATDFARVNENIAKGKQLFWRQKSLLKVSYCQIKGASKSANRVIPNRSPGKLRSLTDRMIQSQVTDTEQSASADHFFVS